MRDRAGAAGLTAGKALADRGIAFDWFEKGSMVGGLWRIDNDDGAVAAYKTLHLNSSRPLSQFPSYPMPEDWPDYPPHEQIAAYFQGYAEDNQSSSGSPTPATGWPWCGDPRASAPGRG